MFSRLRADRRIRAAIVLVVLCCAGYTLYDRWDQARAALAVLSPWVVAGSLAAALAGLGAQMLAWRALLADLGSPLSVGVAARVMFVGQLGKYLPGSVWAFAAQVELARDHEVGRRRGAFATLLAVVVTLTVNLVVAALTLPFAAEEAARRWWWALACAPLLLVALHPRVVTWLLRAVPRSLRREPAARREEAERVSGAGMATAVGWSLLAWLPLGLHVWLLVDGVGGAGVSAFPVATGAYALAWTLGVVVVIAPAGFGVREVVLVAALAPVLEPGPALVVAALSRLVMTLTDLLWAGLAMAVARPAPR
ncbi:lysylphosphatidylglycerol synthase domain-containing protein [Marinactinospora thermotolerans]|uniref:lysylphosphatidylglycerol synthase domain-containing protein n=1 Tax=Marinactinospora thermotolerans TaxID=531310 RepID=UPI00190EF1D9|nr:lysylphosphatidylglycerol synthase domain-containing protein [Marinactinospora thermotolerans]